MKKTKKELVHDIYLMGVNSVFMYECGEEVSSWHWLFMREVYIDYYEEKYGNKAR